MHFESLDSSAVDELHKLTDYNSGHQLENQFYFHFLGKILDVFASCSQCNAINYFDCSTLLSLSPYHCQSCCSGRGANVGLRPYGFLTFLHLDCLKSLSLSCNLRDTSPPAISRGMSPNLANSPHQAQAPDA